MTADRTTIRQTFANLLSNAMVGDGLLLQAVYPYRIGDFGGATPVIALGSGGTERSPLTVRGGRRAYLLDLFIFVLYALSDEEGHLVLDANGEPVWDERNAEDTMDALEAQVGELVEGLGSNRPLWQKVTYASASQPEVATIGGLPYYLEVVPLRFDAY